MSKSKVFWIVLITIVIVGAVLGVGYALYRYGYARGATVDMGEFMHDRFSGEMDERWGRGFGEHVMPWGQSMMGRGYSMPFYGAHGFFGLLLGGGVLALAVYGVISLVRKKSASGEEMDTKAKKK